MRKTLLSLTMLSLLTAVGCGGSNEVFELCSGTTKGVYHRTEHRIDFTNGGWLPLREFQRLTIPAERVDELQQQVCQVESKEAAVASSWQRDLARAESYVKTYEDGTTEGGWAETTAYGTTFYCFYSEGDGQAVITCGMGAGDEKGSYNQEESSDQMWTP